MKKELEEKTKILETFKEKEDMKKKESEEVSLTSRIANSVKEVLGSMGLSRGSGGAAFDATGGQGSNPGAASHCAMGQAPLQAHVAEPQQMFGAAVPQQYGYNVQGSIQPPLGVTQPAAFFHPYNAAVQGQLQMYDGMRAMDMAMGIAGVAQRQQAHAGAEPFAGLKHIDGYRGYAPLQKEWRDVHRRSSRGSRRSPTTSRSRSTSRSGKRSQAAGSHGPTNSSRASNGSRGRSRSPMLPTRSQRRGQRAGRDTPEGAPGSRHDDHEGRQGDRRPGDKSRPIKITDAKEKWSASEMWRRAADLVRAGAEIEPDEGSPKVTDEPTAMEYANWLAEQTTLKVLIKIGDDAGITKVCSSKPKQAQNLIKAIYKNFEADEEE